MSRCLKPAGNCRNTALLTSPYCSEHTAHAEASRQRAWGTEALLPLEHEIGDVRIEPAIHLENLSRVG